MYFAFNDGMTPENSCQCSACRRQYNPALPFEKQASGWAFRFVARYAEAIRAIWPDRRLATLAYQHYQAPPEGMRIPDNVDVTYVTKIVHYASDPDLFNQELEKVHAWSKLLNNKTERFGIWLNIVDPATYTSKVPFMYPNIFKRWLLATRDVTDSCFINGLNSRLNRSGEEGRLNAFSTYPMVWLQSRLLWNPEYSVDELLWDYIRNSFGPAADTMRRFHDLIISRWEGIPWSPETMDEIAFIHCVRYDEDRVRELKLLLNQAAAQCEPGSPEHRRIVFWRDRIYSRFFRNPRASINMPIRFRNITAEVFQRNRRSPTGRSSPWYPLVERQWGGPPKRQRPCRCSAAAVSCFSDWKCRMRPRKMNSAYLRSVIRMPCRKITRPMSINDGHSGRSTACGMNVTMEHSLPYSVFRFPGGGKLRLQIMRYGGVWNRSDLWSPTLRPIADFPVKRFGRVIFDRGEE
ncbi:MAG: DUF4838 domain-containing protein [Lentisphaeria bacterium]|nr:MAG: DUF4838 domain-containing protein [Lentisphaeria bacterium]